MAGQCQYERGGHNYWSYDYDYNDGFNDGHEDAMECLEWCKQKSGFTDYAVGCYFESEYNFCYFLEGGNITGAGGPTEDTCWKFDLSNTFIQMNIVYQG